MKKSIDYEIAENKFWQFVVQELAIELEDAPEDSMLRRVKRGPNLQRAVAKCIFNALKEETVANLLSKKVFNPAQTP